MTELKPCPFCGSPAKVGKYIDGTAIVHCSKWERNNSCEHLVGIGGRTVEEAVKLWNTRKGETDEND